MFDAYGLSAAIGVYSLLPFGIGGALMALLVRRAESLVVKALVIVLLGAVEVTASFLLLTLTGFGPLELSLLGLLVLPVWHGPNVISLLFFWLPISIQSLYCLRAKPPRPLVAALASVGAIVFGVLFFFIGGALTGATSD